MRSLPAAQAPAVVASGSSPLGSAIVRSLAEAGHPVSFGCDPETRDGAEMEQELADAGHLVAAFELNVLDSSSMGRFKDLSTGRFGPPLCVVANSPAGISAHDGGEPDWNRVVDASLSAAFRLVQQFTPEMQSREYGRVVLVGSAASLVGRPEQAAFCAASAGLEGLTRSLAVKLAPFDVLVNAVAPGYIEEDRDGLTPEVRSKKVAASIALRRVGQATEVAEAVRFLCGPGPSAMTGNVLRVDGGLTA
ncbi:SDR family NAD(P)-dependent oxidoreductase [Candidatus Poriferisocius sp.]|uniref:SDR family NAD(P)-dependent oxidoreductase n=1 Tax=Candidatus Poriferisocius sp. TaxID=3101276 RepID=UPI003B5241D4